MCVNVCVYFHNRDISPKFPDNLLNFIQCLDSQMVIIVEHCQKQKDIYPRGYVA